MMNQKTPYRLLYVTLALLTLSLLSAEVSSRPVTSKSGSNSTLVFKRQKNTLSNLDFQFTNKGVLFNNDQTAGLNWPRGTPNSYIFGGGLWFATKKFINGKKKKLVELGYNPNSGAGWYTEGEYLTTDEDNGTANSSKYISYMSPRYDKNSGRYTGGVNNAVPPPYASWPLWDTADTKTLKQNYYFGDYISSKATRETLATKKKANGQPMAPAMLSQEDIVNIYSDYDVAANPEYKQGAGYPFGLNIVEVIYSWSFGRYRDMIFLRHKVTNVSKDTLFECFISPAFDPDLGVGSGGAGNDFNSFYGLNPEDLTRAKRIFPPSSPYYSDPTKLNMGMQWSAREGGKEYGIIGFAFLESPAVVSGVAIDNSDSSSLGGYGPSAKQQLGITTFKKWTISNDPPTPDLRYDFLADGTKDHDITTIGDLRLLFGTGPFTLFPGKSVETTVAIGIALASTTNLEANKDSIVKLIGFAHTVFADTNGSYAASRDSSTTIVKHFITPVPPEIPNIKTTGLDRAVLIEWDKTADNSVDPLSTTLAFNTYELYRTTRSDHDSTIRPDGLNPTVKLGTWSRYNLRQDSIIRYDTVKLNINRGTTKKDTTITTINFLGFKYTRTNPNTPNVLPHSFLDLGDDNADGVLTGNEGLLNNVKYYYFLLATDEYDSINKVGPLTTALVSPKNFVVGIPARPIFPDLPNKIAGDLNCTSGAVNGATGLTPVGGITNISLDIADTGKFVDLFANDTIAVSFELRWPETRNHRFINFNRLLLFVNLIDSNQHLNLTYDNLYHPLASPLINPYSAPSGIVQQVIGQTKPDSNIIGRFTSDDAKFAPHQTVDQAFRLLVDFEFQQLNTPYRLHSLTFDNANKGSSSQIVHLSHRTFRGRPDQPAVTDLSNIPDYATLPDYTGSLGECQYQITFGNPTNFNETEVDTLGKFFTINSIKDPLSPTEFHPTVLPIIITSKTHCDAVLKPIRPGYRNDVMVEGDYSFYIGTVTQNGNIFAAYTDPDTMLTPQPGKYAVDAYHFGESVPGDASSASFLLKTTGMNYFPYSDQNSSNGQTLATVHRIRLAGAEIMLNYPGIQAGQTTGDTTIYAGPASKDFQTGDKIYVGFTGLARGLPFPGAPFTIYTSQKHLNFADNDLYKEQKILDEVQVVPNPYIVTNLGQTSTQNSKLFFTRLPPRATIQIYTLSGELVNTLEHRGYSLSGDAVNLNDRYQVEEWNLLSAGRQRVGSQVLIARIIAKDPKTDAVLGETTKKFAVILGGYRQVTGN